MLLELLPELFPPILTLLSVKDIKNVSLCSKQCHHRVAPTLWENVVVTWKRLLASTSIPNRIALTRNLRIDCNLFEINWSKEEEEELTKKLVALLELSSPTTFSLFRCSEVSIVTRCLATISELACLKSLNASLCCISDTALEHIGRLTGLTNLNLSINRGISDDGLKHLGHLTRLVNLDISDNRGISDAGLKYLHHMTALVNLDVSRFNMSDDGLKHLSHMTRLMNLDVSESNLSDDGLKHLSHLTGLKTLNVALCNISDAGLKNLRHLTGLTILNLRQ